jgi:hypothetical protein
MRDAEFAGRLFESLPVWDLFGVLIAIETGLTYAREITLAFDLLEHMTDHVRTPS